MITSYNVISADGFIARLDGNEDFIPDNSWVDFLEMCRKNDTIVIGRKTYDTIQKYDGGMIKEFEDLAINKIIVTNNRKFTAKSGYALAHSLEEAFAKDSNILLSSGTTLNSSVLKEGLIDEVVLNIIPVKINAGIKVFNENPELELTSTVNKPDGRKLCTYRLKK